MKRFDEVFITNAPWAHFVGCLRSFTYHVLTSTYNLGAVKNCRLPEFVLEKPASRILKRLSFVTTVEIN